MTRQTDRRRMRVGGVAFLLCGAALLAIGVYLLSAVMGWRTPIDGAGLSVLWLLVTGAAVMLMGAEMLLFARRPRGLLRLVVVLLGIFVVAGVVVTLQEGGRLPRLYR